MSGDRALNAYYGTGAATKYSTYRTENYIDGFLTIAANEDEANGWAMRMLMEKHPQRDGYTNHSVKMYLITPETLKEMYEIVIGPLAAVRGDGEGRAS